MATPPKADTVESLRGSFITPELAVDPAAFKPVPGGSLRHIDCSYHSVTGLIRSQWHLDDGQFILSITTPVATDVQLPDGSAHQVAAGAHEFRCALD